MVLIKYILRKCVRLTLLLVLLTLVAAIIVVYFGRQWQPSSYNKPFSKIFNQPVYLDMMDDMDKEVGIVLQGEDFDAMQPFLMSYLTRAKQSQLIKFRDPSIRENLELTSNYQVQKLYQKMMDVVSSDAQQDRSLWVIDARNYNMTGQFVKSVLSLKKKYSGDRFLVVTSSDIPNMKGFRKYKFSRPQDQEVKKLIKDQYEDINQLHVDNLFWYYGDELGEIAKVIDEGPVDRFYAKFRPQYFDHRSLGQEQSGILAKVCQSGKTASDEVKALRLSWLVTFKDGNYYWNSPEGLMVYSGKKETRCKIPQEYVTLSESDRQGIQKEIDEQIRLQRQKQKQMQELQRQRLEQEEEQKKRQKAKQEEMETKTDVTRRKSKKSKAKDENKNRKDRKKITAKQRKEYQQPENTKQAEQDQQDQDNKTVAKTQNQASRRLQQRRSKKTIDQEQSQDVQREEKTGDQDDDEKQLQVDLLNEMGEQEDSYDGLDEQVIDRRVRLAQKKTKKQRGQDLDQLQDRLKRIQVSKKLQRTKKMFRHRQ